MVLQLDIHAQLFMLSIESYYVFEAEGLVQSSVLCTTWPAFGREGPARCGTNEPMPARKARRGGCD
eukprot:scaffold3236_cov66-Cylindrotheca_fusiformis.AAC.9